MDETPVTGAVVHVRYWAAAKAAAGTAGDDIEVTGPVTLHEVRRRAVDLHPGTRLADVLGACSALVGEQPVGSRDPAEVEVPVGATVEFLPPFAGG